LLFSEKEDESCDSIGALFGNSPRTVSRVLKSTYNIILYFCGVIQIILNMKKGETFDIDPLPFALLFCDNLSEKDRRLFCGLEAIRHGIHGVSRVSDTYKINPHTVRAGKAELLSGNLLPFDKVRRPGGGRKKKPCYREFGQRSDGQFTAIYGRQSDEYIHPVD
jgi:hypothetical protein